LSTRKFEDVAPERSRLMAQVKGKNTKPELVVRLALHGMGYRFRLHRGDLPGRPDIVLPKYKMAIFVHGCFWHRHPHCPKSTTPKTRVEFWEDKFNANVARDARNVDALNASGWRVMIVWECETKNVQALKSRLLAAMAVQEADDGDAEQMDR
jgi:DNA mismatch endonuclease (patch repair protein)